MWVAEVPTNPKSKNLLGKKFDKLKVLFACGVDKTGLTLWLCSCKCGKLILSRTGDLLRRSQRSCGRGCKSNLEWGEARFNHVFDRYRRQAKQRSLAFDLTKQEARCLLEGNCYYCGSPPSNISKRKYSFGEFVYSGIDRVDNSMGYNVKNCVSCCTLCNQMKWTQSKDEFLAHIHKIKSNLEI